ncbi:MULTISPECIES: hypothetical protein [Vibrio]|uniref:hypothetical protein n=1 Tax=Vibrio TaxID=662 RepID=UPI000299F2AA|nr:MULTISPECIES: hypothetical protein [Vibrio]OEE26658.1 hypothetical protein OAM_10520 [Vibrio cyclitrophicus ZF14]CAK3965742.1 conserved hypothetical protein [Vibrio crassostreae]
MNKNPIEDMINLIPELTDFGIGIYPNHQGDMQNEDIFRESQLQLLGSVKDFDKAVNWLKKVEKISNFNTKRSSNNLKLLAERDIGYISNGIFIAAAIHSGFRFKLEPESPNVQFNMSERSLKKLEDY